jgi:predicted transcriptional regulator
MVATTLKLPPELKKRIAPLARLSGKTPHAWMVDTLRLGAELSEQRESFIDDAEAAAADIDAGGPVFAMEDVHAFIREKAAGRRVPPPAPVVAKRRR